MHVITNLDQRLKDGDGDAYPCERAHQPLRRQHCERRYYRKCHPRELRAQEHIPHRHDGRGVRVRRAVSNGMR